MIALLIDLCKCYWFYMMARIFLIYVNMIIISVKVKMRKLLSLQEKRDIMDEVWELPSTTKPVARMYGPSANNIRSWKADFHDFSHSIHRC